MTETKKEEIKKLKEKIKKLKQKKKKEKKEKKAKMIRTSNQQITTTLPPNIRPITSYPGQSMTSGHYDKNEAGDIRQLQSNFKKNDNDLINIKKVAEVELKNLKSLKEEVKEIKEENENIKRGRGRPKGSTKKTIIKPVLDEKKDETIKTDPIEPIKKKEDKKILFPVKTIISPLKKKEDKKKDDETKDDETKDEAKAEKRKPGRPKGSLKKKNYTPINTFFDEEDEEKPNYFDEPDSDREDVEVIDLKNKYEALKKLKENKDIQKEIRNKKDFAFTQADDKNNLLHIYDESLSEPDEKIQNYDNSNKSESKDYS